MTFGPCSHGAVLQSRSLLEQIQAGKVKGASAHWSEQDAVKLLGLVVSHGLNFRKISRAFGERKGVQDCMRHVELVMLEAEAGRSAKRRKPQPRKSIGTASSTAARAPLLAAVGRLTERQQLALLLQTTAVEAQEAQEAKGFKIEGAGKASGAKEAREEAQDAEELQESSESDDEDAREQCRPQEYSEWTVAKKRRWDDLAASPDPFYYEHAPPGRTLKLGPWCRAEEELLVLMHARHPPVGHWGLFSFHIPGRNGRQCEQTIRRLKKSGGLAAIQSRLANCLRAALPNKQRQSPPHTPKLPPKLPKPSSAKPNSAKRKRVLSEDDSLCKHVLELCLPVPATTPPRGQQGALDPKEQTPQLMSPRAGAPQAPNATKLAKARSRTVGMSPVKLVGLGGLGGAASGLPKGSAAGRRGKTGEADKEFAAIGAQGLPEGLLGVAPLRQGRGPQQAAVDSSRGRPLAPTALQSAHPTAFSPAPFSSGSLWPRQAPEQLAPELTEHNNRGEAARLTRAHNLQMSRLKEACQRHLHGIQRQYDGDGDDDGHGPGQPAQPEADSRFTFIDGCKSLLMMRKWSESEEDKDAAREPPTPSFFEMPTPGKEQMRRRSMVEHGQAQREATRVHQIQMEALEALQRGGLLFR